jgi:hypothetical protein
MPFRRRKDRWWFSVRPRSSFPTRALEFSKQLRQLTPLLRSQYISHAQQYSERSGFERVLRRNDTVQQRVNPGLVEFGRLQQREHLRLPGVQSVAHRPQVLTPELMEDAHRVHLRIGKLKAVLQALKRLLGVAGHGRRRQAMPAV